MKDHYWECQAVDGLSYWLWTAKDQVINTKYDKLPKQDKSKQN